MYFLINIFAEKMCLILSLVMDCISYFLVSSVWVSFSKLREGQLWYNTIKMYVFHWCIAHACSRVSAVLVFITIRSFENKHQNDAQFIG